MSLSSYKYIKKIGQGAYGEVWLVDDSFKKKCVLKKISFFNASEKEKAAARSECQLLKQLIHPNIVQYRDSFEESGSLFIAMSYCEGGDLYSKIKERHGRSLSEKQITEWFIQIVMALSYMHERNILHRDLKTQNIFLAKSSVIKVGDLGIAKQLQNKNDMAVTMIGTPYYMSPELFNKKPYNFKSDIWSLGCVTYEMATLKHAFNAKNFSALSYKIIMGQMPPMPTIYSKDLTNLIEAMLNNNPAKRPSTNKILRETYVQQHIKDFLEKSKRFRKKSESPQGQPIIHRDRPNSGNNKSKSNGSSPFKNSPERLPGKFMFDPKLVPRLSSHLSDDPEFVGQQFCNYNPKNSLVNDQRRSSQTALEKEIAKIDVVTEIKQSSPKEPFSACLKHAVSTPQIVRKGSDDGSNPDESRTPERQSARFRRRERHRNQGLSTMFFASDDDHSCEHNKVNGLENVNSDGLADSNKHSARHRRQASSENEQTVILPQLMRRNDNKQLDNVEDGGREELFQVFEKMNETLCSVFNKKIVELKNSHHSTVIEHDDITIGPEEDCNETIDRRNLHDKRYPEIKNELIRSIGDKKLAAGYDILRDMGLNTEHYLKLLLGDDDYDKYLGKIMWLKMVDEGSHSKDNRIIIDNFDDFDDFEM